MAQRYDLKAVGLSIGTVSMGGYGENGGIEFEDERDLGSYTVGADGLAVFNANNSSVVFCTITLLESARSYTLLALEMEARRILSQVGGPLPPLPFFMFDRINGDSVSGANCNFMQRPMQNKARGVSERVFRVGIPKAVRLYGTLNLSPI